MDEAGRVTVGKSFSTPQDFTLGILDAIDVVAEARETTRDRILAAAPLFLHSTTVAENAIIGGELGPVGLLTTRGHRDTLFATRGGFGRWSGLTEAEKRNPTETTKPAPLVPVNRIQTVRERTSRDGQVQVPLGDEDVENAIRALLAAGAESIGVCFLWSFVNPRNEVIARDVISRLAPNAFVTVSHEIAPIAGEYERTSTVVLNAALGRVVRGYLGTLRSRLEEEGFHGTVLVMQAHGGLVSVPVALTRPVGMIESGPVSGLMGCRRMGKVLGVENIISADLGGTTFKVGLVRGGLVEYQREPLIRRYHYALPKVDVESLGLAGGSIVSIDEQTGTPRIGPKSAGSYPGPVAYGHGGTEPTITDVDVVLGFMNPSYFLGGRAGLDAPAARASVATLIAEPLGLDVSQAAAAVYLLANSYIYDLLHRMTVQRGIDPRDCVLFSVGGTAGMHLPAVASHLGIPRVVIPATASVAGAFGLVTSDVVHEELITEPMAGPWDPLRVEALFERLTDRIRRQLSDDAFAREDTRLDRAIDMRYRQQVHVVTVPVLTPGPVTTRTLRAVSRLFEDMYRSKYGPESTYAGAGLELVTFRLRGTGLVANHDPSHFGREPRPAPHASPVVPHRVYLPATNEPADIPGYDFQRLPAGCRIPGPAVIWSPTTTVLIGAEQEAELDLHHNVVITFNERSTR
jgi:N-methylhydantoinase A